jgi:hypothetical protein
MEELGEEDEVPRSYADLFVARLGRIVSSTEIATYRIEEDFAGPELRPVSYFRTSGVSPDRQIIVQERLMPFVQGCLERGSDACIQLPDNQWCLIILLGRAQTPEAAAAFVVTASDKKKAMTGLKMLQGAGKK